MLGIKGDSQGSQVYHLVKGNSRGVAGCLIQTLIQPWIPPPQVSPLEKGGQPKVAVLIIDKHIFSQLQANHEEVGVRKKEARHEDTLTVFRLALYS